MGRSETPLLRILLSTGSPAKNCPPAVGGHRWLYAFELSKRIRTKACNSTRHVSSSPRVTPCCMHLACSLPRHMHGHCLPKFTIPDESLFEEDAAKLCMMRECESVSSVWPSRLSRSVLFPRPRCVLPPSDGQLARGSNVPTASGPPCHMSDKKSLQENTLFMVYVSVISPPKCLLTALQSSPRFPHRTSECRVVDCFHAEMPRNYFCMPLH